MKSKEEEREETESLESILSDIRKLGVQTPKEEEQEVRPPSREHHCTVILGIIEKDHLAELRLSIARTNGRVVSTR